MEYGKSREYMDKEREAAQIRKDIQTAHGIITDGINRYIKKMLRARSKKQAEDLSVFDELKDYNSIEDIRNAYGWDIITEAQMDRLMEMWEAREKYIDASGKFSDRVTKMLFRIRDLCGGEFSETLEEFDAMKARRDADIKAIEKRNAEIDYEMFVRGLK